MRPSNEQFLDITVKIGFHSVKSGGVEASELTKQLPYSFMEVVLSPLSLSACVSVTAIVSLMATQLLTIRLRQASNAFIFLNAELSFTKHFGELLLQIIYL